MASLNNGNTRLSYNYGPPTNAGKIPFTPPGTEPECETAYWLWGDLASSKLPPLIILHGGPGAPGRDWKPVAALHEKYGIPVLMYDQIGCGASTHLRDKKGDITFWTDALFLAELDNVKKHLQIETFDLLGHSCGGMLAAMYAVTQPRGLRKLIIASAPASDALRLRAQKQRRADLPQDMQDALSAGEKEGRTDSPAYQRANDELERRYFCRLDPYPSEIRETEALMMEDDTVSDTLYGSTPLEITGPRKDYDVIDRLSEISEKTVPGGVLLTNGHYDQATDEAMEPFFAKIRARVKWIRFAASAHFPHLEEPQAYLTALGEFLHMV